MIALATQDEIKQLQKRVDALEEYLKVREIHAISSVGTSLRIVPDEAQSTPPSK